MMTDDPRPGSTREPTATATSSGRSAPAPVVDLELLTELVYQRWLDELRRERERGAWPS